MSNQITQDIILNHRFLPSQDEIETDTTFTINSSYYTSDGSLYNSSTAISEPYNVMGENGISISIFPFKYNPQLNKITVLKQATFTVNYTSLKGGEIPNPSPTQKSFLSSFFANYNYLKSGSNLCGRYLIITSPQFENTIKCFANYKTNIGYQVDVVNTTTTGSSVANIYNYIQSKYNNLSTRPDYVLLVGDHTSIPASAGNITGNDNNDPITDIGYSTLEGGDYLADVFLGRFSVNTVEELQNIINKSIYMETNLHLFAKKAKFLAGQDHSFWCGWYLQAGFENGHNDVIKDTFEPAGYNCQKLYQPNDVNATLALNDNPLFYIYSGHGNANAWMGDSFQFYVSDANNSDLKRDANNTVYPFVFAFSCKTGNFANSSLSICEDWIRQKKAGVTYFGSSVITRPHSDIVIEKKIFGDAFTDENNISNIITLGKKRYYISTWSKANRHRSRRYIKSYNLLGDPSLNTRGIGCINNFTFNNNEIFYSGANITYKAGINIQNNANFTIESNANIILAAGNSIILNPGFTANLGATFEAKIEPCSSGQ